MPPTHIIPVKRLVHCQWRQSSDWGWDTSYPRGATTHMALLEGYNGRPDLKAHMGTTVRASYTLP